MMTCTVSSEVVDLDLENICSRTSELKTGTGTSVIMDLGSENICSQTSELETDSEILDLG